MWQADAAWNNVIVTHPDRVAAARAAFIAAKAAYKRATLLKYLSASASVIFLTLIPGLLYAMKPSLLGGLWGRLLRPSSARLALRLPRRRHPVTFYQGIGVVLISIPGVVANLAPAVTLLISAVRWLNLLALLLFLPCYLIGPTLIGQTTWWFTSGRSAERGQERPQA